MYDLFTGLAVHRAAGRVKARDSHLDLIRAPYVLYGVKYIDLVSLALFSGKLVWGDLNPEHDGVVKQTLPNVGIRAANGQTVCGDWGLQLPPHQLVIYSIQCFVQPRP